MTIAVEMIEHRDHACDQFVQRHPGAFLCHCWSWGDLVARRMRHNPVYLAIREGGEVRGVLPLTHVRSLLFGNRLVSQALSNYGGPLVQDGRYLAPLYHRAVELATQRHCRSIELRGIVALPFEPLHTRDDKMCMHLSLNSDPNVLWRGFDPKVRNQVRKAEKSAIVPDSGGVELLADLYDVYSIRMRQLGTPPYPRSVMKAILENFPDNSRIFRVRLEGKTVGAGFVTWFNGLMEIPWAATLVEYNTLCPNHLLYWAVIQHACKAGLSRFDFGRSTEGGGAYQFKKQWGPQPVRLAYQYWVPEGGSVSDLNPQSDAYRRKVEMWKRLPLWLTRWIGPSISRGLP